MGLMEEDFYCIDYDGICPYEDWFSCDDCPFHEEGEFYCDTLGGICYNELNCEGCPYGEGEY